MSLVYNLRENHDLPIFLNADHTYSLEKVKEAALFGYDSIIFDGAKLPYEENIKQTREAVKIAKDINTDIIVEGVATSGNPRLCRKLPEERKYRTNAYIGLASGRVHKETGVDLLLRRWAISTVCCPMLRIRR